MFYTLSHTHTPTITSVVQRQASCLNVISKATSDEETAQNEMLAYVHLLFKYLLKFFSVKFLYIAITLRLLFVAHVKL